VGAVPVASKPTCRCMKEGHAGVSCFSRRHCSGTEPGGSSLRVSHTLALEMTAWGRSGTCAGWGEGWGVGER
jgi:hypothetical protein